MLVGMMGSGKTRDRTAPRRRLGLKFIDADSEIAAAAGMSIPEIFAKYGEGYFRDGERRVLARFLNKGPRCWRPAAEHFSIRARVSA